MKPIELALPSTMSDKDRASEITTILAAAIIRMHTSRQATTERQIGLGFMPGKSVHTNPYQPRSFS
jgi:hypothetical protein